MIVNTALLVALGGAFWWIQDYEPESPLTAAMIGTPAPPFELPLVAANEANRPMVAVPQPRLTLLNFWASWCGACAQEEPQLTYLWENYGSKDSLAMVGVATSDQWSELLSSPKLAAKHFPVVFDEKGEVARRYGIAALPVSVLINQEGKVLARIEGILDEKKVQALEKKFQKQRLSRGGRAWR